MGRDCADSPHFSGRGDIESIEPRRHEVFQNLDRIVGFHRIGHKPRESLLKPARRALQDIGREKRLLKQTEQRENQALKIWVERQMRMAQKLDVELKQEFASVAKKARAKKQSSGVHLVIRLTARWS